MMSNIDDNISPYSLYTGILNRQHFSKLESGRSMAKRNKKLFDTLKQIASDYGYSGPYHDGICVRTDADSKLWLQYSSAKTHDIDIQFNKTNVNGTFSIAEFYYDNDKYIILSGLESIELDSDGFELIENNAGIFTLFASVNFIRLKNAPLNIGHIFNDFLFTEPELEIKYVDYLSLNDFYEPYFVFKVYEDTRFHNLDITRMSAYVALENNKEFYSNEKEDLHHLLLDLIIEGDPSINLSKLAKCICIKDEPYILFMELYRMLERVYSIPTIKSLQGKLEINEHCFWSVLKKLEEATGWKKNEKEGLKSLLLLLNDSNLKQMYYTLKENHNSDFVYREVESRLNTYDNAIQNNQGVDLEQLKKDWRNSMVTLIRNYIYSVRNSYVHYREALDVHLTEEQLTFLCQALLVAINPIYINIVN